MAEVGNVSVKLDLDTAEALRRMRELEAAAQPVAELIEMKRDWLPYIIAAGGWIAAIVAIVLD